MLSRMMQLYKSMPFLRRQIASYNVSYAVKLSIFKKMINLLFFILKAIDL